MAIPQIVQPATGLAPGLNMAINDMVGPVSYATGGVNVSANAFGLQSIKSIHPMELSASGTFFTKIFSVAGLGRTTVKVKWFVQATGAEVANATNLSAETVRCTGFGI